MTQTPRTTRRRQAAEQTRRRLIAAARRLFHARGFDQVTAEQIAAEAGVAKGTLFLHARTKERLLVLMFEEGLTEAVGCALRRARPDRPVVSTLTSVFRQFFRFYEARPELSRRFLREIAMLREPETEVMARLRLDLSTGLAALIEARQARGEVLGDVDAHQAAGTSFALYFWVLLAWLSGLLPDARARDRALAAHLGLLWRGLLRERVSP